jgi:predicted nucleotide-binding protein (sugar kinase/HSP70/actin superfamily)
VKQKEKHRFGSKGSRNPFTHAYRVGRIALAERLLGRMYDRLRGALGGTTHKLVNQLHLQRLGHPFYNTNAEGGEGHLEVAKNIYYFHKNLCHMVMSLKPFGCMPSTQSDGAQAAVVGKFPDMVYLPVETSGEGEINAHSRAQMALGEARKKCKEEYARALADTKRTDAEMRSGLYHVPEDHRYAGTAARFVAHVAKQMETGR